MTDKAITRELGGRLKQRRLNKNITQKEVAATAGISVTAVQGAEKGETTLLTFVKVLRVLRSLDTLEGFLPEMDISPLQLARMEGKKRRKASGRKKGKNR